MWSPMRMRMRSVVARLANVRGGEVLERPPEPETQYSSQDSAAPSNAFSACFWVVQGKRS